MNVIQVNDLDLIGRRFNGYNLQAALNECGQQAKQVVISKSSEDENVVPLINGRSLIIKDILKVFEQRMSINGIMPIFGRILKEHQVFKDADLVHYHLIHNDLISILDLPELTTIKPSVWTLHDPWAFTGHCVHPLECTKWKSGCHNCTHVHDYFPLEFDNAYQIWNLKKQAYNKMNVDIVVSSNFMLNFIKESPLATNFTRVHMIPFGIDTDKFRSISQNDARNKLGITQNSFVVAFRCEDSPLKGTQYVLDALEKIQEKQQITLLTIGFKKLPLSIKKKYKVVELGWQDNPDIIYSFYSACDVFVMPSIAESFGLMAIEAMATGRPVVVFEKTALVDVTFAPQCGVSVAYKDSDEIKNAIIRLLHNGEEAKKRGQLGQDLAEKHYKFRDYVEKHISLYNEILNNSNI